MKILFLDDSKQRYYSFVRNNVTAFVDLALTSEKAIQLLKIRQYDVIMLDHDLENEHYVNQHSDEKTGQEVANYIAANKNNFLDCLIVCHSLNFHGRSKMIKTLQEAELKVLDKPFAWEILKFEKYIRKGKSNAK